MGATPRELMEAMCAPGNAYVRAFDGHVRHAFGLLDRQCDGLGGEFHVYDDPFAHPFARCHAYAEYAHTLIRRFGNDSDGLGGSNIESCNRYAHDASEGACAGRIA